MSRPASKARKSITSRKKASWGVFLTLSTLMLVAALAAALAWLGAAAGARIARVGPVILLLANGDTRGVLAGSFLRAIALVTPS